MCCPVCLSSVFVQFVVQCYYLSGVFVGVLSEIIVVSVLSSVLSVCCQCICELYLSICVFNYCCVGVWYLVRVVEDSQFVLFVVIVCPVCCQCAVNLLSVCCQCVVCQSECVFSVGSVCCQWCVVEV
jgi:hypothetical protein